MTTKPVERSHDANTLREQLATLKMPYALEHYEALAAEAAAHHWIPLEYFARLIEGESAAHDDRRIQRRIKNARFPVIKTLEHFQWSWPKKINRAQIQNHFRLAFVADKANLIFLGGVGLGKTHLSIALGHTACLHGYSVLFATAIDIVHTLTAAQQTHTLKHAMRKYLKPAVLLIDELGYLPIDKTGADLLFQIISARYERGSTVVTANRAYKHWAEIFNHDSTLTSALLDRLLHHADTCVLEGKSYRAKDQIET